MLPAAGTLAAGRCINERADRQMTIDVRHSIGDSHRRGKE
jgi:hypothetical protein